MQLCVENFRSGEIPCSFPANFLHLFRDGSLIQHSCGSAVLFHRRPVFSLLIPSAFAGRFQVLAPATSKQRH